MIQELFHIGPIVISPFGVLLVLAFFSGYLQLKRGMKLLGVGNEEDASTILFAAGVGGILGAKVYYAILYGDWRLLFDRSGLVWYGGFIVATAAVVWVIRRRQAAVLAAPRRRDSGSRARLRRGANRLFSGRRRLWAPERSALGDRLSERPAADDRRVPALGVRAGDSARRRGRPAAARPSDAALRDGTRLRPRLDRLAHAARLAGEAGRPDGAGDLRRACGGALSGRVRARQGRPFPRRIDRRAGDQPGDARAARWPCGWGGAESGSATRRRRSRTESPHREPPRFPPERSAAPAFDRRLGLERRRRNPGRSQDLLRPRRLRHDGDYRHHGPEHAGRDGGPGPSAGARRGPDRCRLRRSGSRCGEDRHACRGRHHRRGRRAV